MSGYPGERPLGLFVGARARRAAGALLSCASIGAFASACYLTADFNGIADGKGQSDASTPETSDGVDAGPDAPAPFSCNGSHLICSTFDNGALDSDGWSIRQTDGGTANLSTNEYVSPPASFHSVIVANNSVSVLQAAFLTQKVRPLINWKVLDFTFQLRVTSCTAKDNGITILALTPSSEAVFGLVYANNGLVWGQVVTNIGDGGQLFIPSLLSHQPKLKEWILVDIKLQNPASPTVDITFDGVPVLNAAKQVAFTPGGNAIVSLGPDGSGTNAQCEMAFDNVRFDSQ